MKARDNPFATHRVHQLQYRLLNGSWAALLDRLAQLRYRAAIVGPEGSGKTTLLEHLSQQLQSLGYRAHLRQFSRETPFGTPAVAQPIDASHTTRDIILADGTEQLGRLAWRRLRRQTQWAGGLVITAHRSGLLPTLIECRTSSTLLDELLDALLPAPETAVRSHAHWLFQQHQGNLRMVWRGLYDRFADG